MPPRRVTWYCSGVRICFHSASDLTTFSIYLPAPSASAAHSIVARIDQAARGIPRDINLCFAGGRRFMTEAMDGLVRDKTHKRDKGPPPETVTGTDLPYKRARSIKEGKLESRVIEANFQIHEHGDRQ